MPYRGAGGTNGGEGSFLIGIIMILLIGGVGLFLRSLRGVEV